MEEQIMKRKIYLAVMAAAVISMAGCGKKNRHRKRR